MDEVLYSEGAGPATWAVVVLSLVAAGIAGAAWVGYVTTPDPTAVPRPGGAFSSALAAVVGLMVGLAGVDTLVRRKIVLTGTSLSVGREAVALNRLAQPVLAGDRVPEAIRDGTLGRNSLPSGCRVIGVVPRPIPGQGTMTVVSSEPREILVVYAWRPRALAHFLSRALGSLEDDTTRSGDEL